MVQYADFYIADIITNLKNHVATLQSLSQDIFTSLWLQSLDANFDMDKMTQKPKSDCHTFNSLVSKNVQLWRWFIKSDLHNGMIYLNSKKPWAFLLSIGIGKAPD